MLYGDFYLENERFIAMDGPGELSFNESVSLIVTKAFLKMKKFDIQELEAAFNGTSAQLGQAEGA